MNEAEVTCCGFVVPGGEASGAFELVEAALDAVSEGVGDAVDADGLLSIGLAGDDRRSAALADHVADAVAVISLVGDDHLGRWQVLVDEGVEALEVGDLAAAHLRPDREAVSVGNEVNLGRETTF